MSQVLDPVDLSPSTYNILAILRDAGEGGLPTLAIQDRMVRRNPGVTRLLDRLIDMNLVSRTRSKEDRRLVFCEITPEGTELLATVEGGVQDVRDCVTEALDEDELHVVLDALDRIRDRLREDILVGD